MKEGYKYWNYSLGRLCNLKIENCEALMDRYNEGHRFYHNWDHIIDLLSQLEKRGLFDDDALFLATIFHDAVYDPRSNSNESKSVKLFEELYTGNDADLKEEVMKIIIDTETHKPTSMVSEIFCEMDMEILRQPLDKLIEFENKIFKEYQCFDWKDYKEGRIKVLRSLQKDSELEPLISYVRTRKPSIGVYCGTFDPFHVGHENILEKAERIFDKVIIARGWNPEKGSRQYDLPDKIEHRQIENYRGLLTDFIEKLGYDVTVVRGLRNAADLHYEMIQYRFLQDLKLDIKVISIFCDRKFEHVSSSAIKQLPKFKEDKYLVK